MRKTEMDRFVHPFSQTPVVLNDLKIFAIFCLIRPLRTISISMLWSLRLVLLLSTLLSLYVYLPIHPLPYLCIFLFVLVFRMSKSFHLTKSQLAGISLVSPDFHQSLFHSSKHFNDIWFQDGGV